MKRQKEGNMKELIVLTKISGSILSVAVLLAFII